MARTTVATRPLTRDMLNDLKRYPREPLELVISRLATEATEKKRSLRLGEIGGFESKPPGCPRCGTVMKFEGWEDASGAKTGIPYLVRFACANADCGYTLTWTTRFGDWEPI
jgi:hypothetical protein